VTKQKGICFTHRKLSNNKLPKSQLCPSAGLELVFFLTHLAKNVDICWSDYGC